MGPAGIAARSGGAFGATRAGELVQDLESRLVGALRLAGFSVELEPSLDGGDFVAERGQHRYEVELRVAREARRVELQATLADALLRARAAAGPGRRALAVVGAMRVTSRLAAEVRAYAASFLGAEAFGIVDAAGRLELHGPGLDEVRGPAEDGPPPAPARPAAPLFSDRSQWLLKVLLAQRLPPALLAAPRGQLPSASQLARLGEVSVPSAARLVSVLRAGRYLPPKEARGRWAFGAAELKAALGDDEGEVTPPSGGRPFGEERAAGPGLVLARAEELLRRWQNALAQPARELPARWLIPSTNPRRQLTAALAAHARRAARAARDDDAPFPVDAARPRRPPRACLGLFSACTELGFAPIHGAPQHLYLEEPSAPALAQLGLAAAAPGEAPHVLIRVPRCPEAVFRAAVVRGGAPVADVVQCWLDVADHPARGAELAASLWRDSLGPALRERG